MSIFNMNSFLNNNNKNIFNQSFNNTNIDKGNFSDSNNLLKNKNMFMPNTSSNSIFGSFNQGNSNKSIFGNTNIQTNITNTDHSLFGSAKTQQSNALVNKSLFNIGNVSTSLTGNKGLYDNINNQSNLSTKNLFGTSNVNTSSQGNLGSGLFMNTNNQNNMNMKNIFGTSSLNTQGTSLTNKSIFGSLQPNNQTTTSNNIFGNLSTNQSNSRNIFGNLSSTTQNKTSIFGTLPTTNQNTSSIFGSASTTNQNKTSSIFGTLPASNQTTTTGNIFGGLSTNQTKPTSNIFGTLPGATTNTPTSNIFGNATTTNQNKTSSIFGTLPASNQTTTTGNIFGGLSTNQAKPTSNIFGTLPGATTNTSTSNIFGNATTTNQNKTSSIFGTLPASNQTTTTGNIFGGLSTNQAKPTSNIFGTLQGTTTNTSTSNIFGNATTTNQNKTSSIFGTLPASNQTTTTGNIFGGLSTNQTKPTSNIFGTLPGATTNTSTSNIFGNATATNQNKTTSIFGSLSTTTQPVNNNIFASTTPTNQGVTSNVFSSTPTSQNKFNNIFGTLPATTQSTTSAITTPTTNTNIPSTNLFGNTTSSTNKTNLNDKNIFGSSSGLVLNTPNANSNATISTNIGSNISNTISSNLNTSLNTGFNTNLNTNLSSNLSGTLNNNLCNNLSNNLTGGLNVNDNTSKSIFLSDKNAISNSPILQDKLLMNEKSRENDISLEELKKDKEDVENAEKLDNIDEDLKIIKSKENIFDKIYNDGISSDKGQERTFYNYINLIINDNINNIQKTTFSLLNDHDSLMWDNFKSNIFKNFVDYLVNFKQKKNQKVIKSNVLDLDQHEFQILIWLYNVNSYKIDFIPFKSFYYMLLSNTHLNYSKFFFGNSEKSNLYDSFVEINDHYYINSKNHFIKSQINNFEENILNNEKSNSTLDFDSFYKQILKDILNSLLNMNLSITKENIKKKEKEEYYDSENKDKINYGNYTYENLLLNYLFGTLQHLHDKFYKIEISNYVSKDINQIEEYFVDTKSNIIFSYCYNNYYKNEMDKENSTTHFFFYLINIMFRCGNYIGLIQIIKNEEFIKHLNIDNYFYDFIILLIRILFLIYNKNNEINIFENMKIEIDCSDILKKKINISNLINFFHSIIYICVNNIYAYDLLCILFSDIFYRNGNIYTNREKKIEMKNIFYYIGKNNNNYDNNHENEITVDNSYKNELRIYKNEDYNNDADSDYKKVNIENNRTPEKERKSKRKTFFFDMISNILQKPKKVKEDSFSNMEINDELDKINKGIVKVNSSDGLGITNKYSYNFEYCNIETSIWFELTLFITKNFDLYSSKFQENFDIIDSNLSFYNYDDDNNAFLNDTKHRREKINNKIEKLFTSISNCIINENKKYLSICSKLKVDDVINNFIIVDGKISEKSKGNILKVLKNNFLLYIKLFYYLLLVGNIYTTVVFLSCISNNLQRILLVLTIFLHKNNIFENSHLNNIKMKTLNFLKFQNENSLILDSSHDINDVPSSDKVNLVVLSMSNNDIPYEYFILKNNNINILLKITYLINLKTHISIKLLKSIVQENQDILLHESIIGHINNNGNIFYGKLNDFLFLFKNKVKIKKDIKCFFLMYYVLSKQKFSHNKISNKKKSENDEYHYKSRNFKFIYNKNINTLSKISLDNSIISVHSSILYKISQFYAILAYFANQRKNYIISFICYYILKDEHSAINSLIRIYNDELIYYFHNNEKEYNYIRKCAFRFYHLAKNMWPSNVKLESIENKSHLVLTILFMKKKMFEEAFIIFSSNLIPENMLEKLSTADYYNIDLSSNFLMTLKELCKKNKINELVDKTTLYDIIKFLLPIKDKLDSQVVESINYLSSLSF
ncbi:nucleoporin NUP100/NSP100, putative [Plasmodium gallinaceum]|uniref:Nucleoporin NUP100/NSP100, putative n=1 Tax=Plasmodium gallinaceum TaxID=5849 RepID=A0A1J1GVY2_PLAGA|nr:nucleoporin NUP100/NSP100, putative [Plasmodium gallinaceum]CRG96595.1 nucleoporin NUP100/NSP100, putative [Plasmodium gallinaceum]